ncbi:host-nuclease inhibitor Gam family protein [Sphingomonas cavernae]|nr:host-nuclease inhibitor Gam family protein [Sphingomonas cavernae]
MSKRRKAATIDAPQTLTEGTAQVVRYAALEREMERCEAVAEAGIAAIKAGLAVELAKHKEAMKPLFKQLAAWWAANQGELTKGKRRSIDIAGVTMGERRTPPSLKLPKDVSAEDMIAKLFGAKRPELVKTQHSLDKAAIIKLLGSDDHAEALEALGLALSQKDEFFIAIGAAEQPVDMDKEDASLAA